MIFQIDIGWYANKKICQFWVFVIFFNIQLKFIHDIRNMNTIFNKLNKTLILTYYAGLTAFISYMSELACRNNKFHCRSLPHLFEHTFFFVLFSWQEKKLNPFLLKLYNEFTFCIMYRLMCLLTIIVSDFAIIFVYYKTLHFFSNMFLCSL